MNLNEVFSASVIEVSLKVKNADDALQLLVEKLVKGNKLKNADAITRLLTEDAVLRATLVGHKAGIVHSRWEGLVSTVGSLGILKSGESIRLGEQLQFKVNVIFLVLSPFQPAELHLDLISRIASLVRTEGMIEKLCQCDNNEDVFDVLSHF